MGREPASQPASFHSLAHSANGPRVGLGQDEVDSTHRGSRDLNHHVPPGKCLGRYMGYKDRSWDPG